MENLLAQLGEYTTALEEKLTTSDNIESLEYTISSLQKMYKTLDKIIYENER